ncbi:hypothetical protein VT84_15760 [Gemmata sp. SH-PL17]|uniref:hypothetical protein n=1 Tax=Gemmata sp. SH-PL17 TaxID=1630693 RepID=UPI0004B46205|nr:hypothetical protein [Gemmata sp. SH-PL17]AMV25854.1 hypothetical protein VT84_15760 [Gemmata sp. SH-PL17]
MIGKARTRPELLGSLLNPFARRTTARVADEGQMSGLSSQEAAGLLEFLENWK